MFRRSTLGLGATLLALACGGCDHAGQPVTETKAAPPTPTATTATAAPTTPAPAPPPAQPTEETAVTAAKPAAAAPAPPSGAPVPGDPSQIRRITIEEANALRQAGSGVILDVRDLASYDLAHIAGAIHIPLGELAQRLGELPHDKPIVTYCA